MKYISPVVLRVAHRLALTLLACAPANEAFPPCLNLNEPAGARLVTEKPAKVSLLFQVDTCQGQPVPGMTANQFTIAEDDRVVSELESQRLIRAKGQRYRLHTALLLDLSGSMLRSGQLDSVQSAARQFVETVLNKTDEGHRIAVLGFDGQSKPEVIVPFTSELARLVEGINSLSVSQCQVNADCALVPGRNACASHRCVDDSTNLHGATVEALGLLETQLQGDSSVALNDAALVLFTDGSDQAARVSKGDAVSAALAARAHVFTVGFGNDIDADTLRQLGKDGFFVASSRTELNQAFSRAALNITQLANRFYLLEYCSPKRSGTHTLKVTARLERDGAVWIGGLSREFSAQGFASGCTLE
jgi:von Willebrand factor type A domain